MANEAKVLEQPKAQTKPKEVMLISIFPNWFTFLVRPWTEEWQENGLRQKKNHPGRGLEFVKNKAIVSEEDFAILRKNRKYGISFWTLADLREKMKKAGPPENPNLYKDAARKLRAEFCRRRAWNEDLKDDAIEFSDILEETVEENPKAGRVKEVF